MYVNPRKIHYPVSVEIKPSRRPSKFYYFPDSKKKNLLEYANALRVLSMLAVVFTHVSSPLVESIRDVHSVNWWVAIIYDSASRWAVPIFVFISGSLLLDPAKDEPIKTFFKKRADRILVPLVFWSMFFSIINIYVYKWSLKLVLLKVFNGVPSVHLWYLYMMLGLYLITPMLRRYVRQATESERLYFIVVAFAIASPFTMYFYVHSREVNVAFLKFIPYTAYFVCGYHLSRVDPACVKLKYLLPILLSSIAVVALGTALLVRYTTGDYVWELFHTHFSPFIIVMSITTFLLFIKLDSLKLPRLSPLYKFFSFMAPYTLGIYIVHIMIIVEIGKYTNIWAYTIHPIIGIPLTSLLTFTVSFLIVYPIGKIPYLKKIVI